MASTLYPGADNRSQWFANAYPGASIVPDKVVLHTTEGDGWPSYSGGAVAPHFTVWVTPGDIRVRQHYPVNCSSRALVNAPGGVETNTDGCVQIELVGTCDPAAKGMLFWPSADARALGGVAALLAWLHCEWDMPLIPAPTWLPYPLSYGASNARMSFDTWRAFSGVCGHQHVPENDHGDPGALPVGRLLAMASALAQTTTTGDDVPASDVVHWPFTPTATEVAAGYGKTIELEDRLYRASRAAEVAAFLDELGGPKAAAALLKGLAADVAAVRAAFPHS